MAGQSTSRKLPNPIAEALKGMVRAEPDDGTRPMIVFLCTGNAARSVMAAAMLRDQLGERSEFLVSSGGTHVLPGQPMSVRTRRALDRHGLKDPWHRSRQLEASDVERAGLILAMEPLHRLWIERTHPDGLAITASLQRAVGNLEPISTPISRADFDQRVAGLHLADHPIGDWEEIIDPASGEQDRFDACSDELIELVRGLTAALAPR